MAGNETFGCVRKPIRQLVESGTLGAADEIFCCGMQRLAVVKRIPLFDSASNVATVWIG